MPIASKAARLLGTAALGIGLALPVIEEAEAQGRRGGGQTQVGRGIGHHGGYRQQGRHHRSHHRHHGHRHHHHRHHGGYAFYGLGLGFGLGALAYADPVYRHDPPPAYYVPPAAYPSPVELPMDPPYPPVPAYPPPVLPANAANGAGGSGKTALAASQDDPANWPLP